MFYRWASGHSIILSIITFSHIFLFSLHLSHLILNSSLLFSLCLLGNYQTPSIFSFHQSLSFFYHQVILFYITFVLQFITWSFFYLSCFLSSFGQMLPSLHFLHLCSSLSVSSIFSLHNQMSNLLCLFSSMSDPSFKMYSCGFSWISSLQWPQPNMFYSFLTHLKIHTAWRNLRWPHVLYIHLVW